MELVIAYAATAADPPPAPEPLDLPDLWGHGSFPASDPPANW